MSLVLKRIGRTELVRQLENCRKGFEHDKSEVIVPLRSGKKGHIVKVDDSERGVFLCMCDDEMMKFISLAPLIGSKIHELDLEELIYDLSERSSEKVWIGWPDNNTHTVVGKVLAVGTKEKLIVSLFPVPEDIEIVNVRVMEICAEYCESAKNGMQCGDCPICGDCEILAMADDKIIKEREGK